MEEVLSSNPRIEYKLIIFSYYLVVKIVLVLEKAKIIEKCSGCDSVRRAVTSYSRGSGFESSHQHIL